MSSTTETSANKPSSVIPSGYSFINPRILLSEKAKKLFGDWAEATSNRNPDNFDMYIYNDFYWYGQLDVVSQALRALHAKITKKDWEEAYAYVEAIVALNELFGSWPMADDGEQVELTNKLIGASIIAVMDGLKSQNKLNPEALPNLGTVLRLGAEWAKSCSMQWDVVLRGIGKRLFQDRLAETIAREKAMVEEWIAGFDEATQKEVREDIAEEEEEDDPDAEPWYEQGEADEERKIRGLAMSTTWKNWTTYLKTVPTLPLRGPPKWDLSTWTAKEKAPFLFDNMDADI